MEHITSSWSDPKSDPIADIRETMKRGFDDWRRPPITVHHPKCSALRTGKVIDCNCGGAAFPVPAAVDDWFGENSD